MIDKISIKKFRGFKDVQFSLGKQITLIAGQNGTQKTTLLGMLSQPFSITDKENPMQQETPLCGGNFKSAFSEKFKLSSEFDVPSEHEWTLSFCEKREDDFTLESIKRSNSDSVRFWRKGDRSRGSGYVQYPVIYLSLSRLFPIGEDNALRSSREITITEEEYRFYKKWHNKILIIPNTELKSAEYLTSKQKDTLCANTDYYDWRMNSAGQDNIGKILLAILSFKRLKEKYGNAYKGGILAIDEVDSTLYPASQVELLKAFKKFASKYGIQFILTTHSLSMLKSACETQSEMHNADKVRVVFLDKKDKKVVPIEDITYNSIQTRLDVALNPAKKITKIPVFTEDEEGKIFLKALLKRRASCLNCYNITMGCGNLIELSSKKIPGFKFPDSLIVLDGDVKADKRQLKKAKKTTNWSSPHFDRTPRPT